MSGFSRQGSMCSFRCSLLELLPVSELRAFAPRRRASGWHGCACHHDAGPVTLPSPRWGRCVPPQEQSFTLPVRVSPRTPHSPRPPPPPPGGGGGCHQMNRPSPSLSGAHRAPRTPPPPPAQCERVKGGPGRGGVGRGRSPPSVFLLHPAVRLCLRLTPAICFSSEGGYRVPSPWLGACPLGLYVCTVGAPACPHPRPAESASAASRQPAPVPCPPPPHPPRGLTQAPGYPGQPQTS